ncbi:MAG TPA: FtsX-like permease family protein [Archangium sp.]|uniref:FtsX-like permease family protein n=1 Tax=Archangium sp. TaxID=1872627 RepID=UPI002E339B20|nr:FtsX-like permease family protein [Archangium sp.]HEX5746302.1 FtsX-like permease family protein [Archangium sp.]
MKALDRKLLRDLGLLKGQVFTVALVVAAGIAVYVTALSTYQSMAASQRVYYEGSRFADVFARLERAPERVLAELETLPGVAEVEARLVEEVLLDMPGMAEPVSGRIVSIPGGQGPRLNRLDVLRGRRVAPGQAHEVLVSEAFAKAHRLEPGDAVVAVLGGRRAELRVVGVALSPEYIYAAAPGGLNDDERHFGVFWMDREVMAPAFHMEGAFNDVVFRLAPGARTEDVLDAVDRVLAPHGGVGAYGRDQQLSHRIVEGELEGLEVEARVMPLIFMAVAAFLVNVVLSRLVGIQREQIAALKAVGYSNARVGWHYLKLVLGVVGLGAGVGVGLGTWLGRLYTGVYMDVFHFPVFVYRLEWRTVAGAVALNALAAALGALSSVGRAVRLPPAEAMRPESPPRYRPTVLERMGLHRMLSQSGRMVLRDLERRPLRLMMSVLGIALAVSIPAVTRYFVDSVCYVMDVQYELVQREDLVVVFREPVPARAVHELEQLPGVRHGEPLRELPVRLEAGPLSREVVVSGLPAGGAHRRVLDSKLREVPLEGGGLILGSELARRLGVEAGDTVWMHVLEGERQVLQVRVARLVDDWIGLSAYMDLDAMARLLGEERTVSAATLWVDPLQLDALQARLKQLPGILGVARKELARQHFEETNAQVLLVFTLAFSIFAVIISVGIVYNNARVTLAVRARDLATLRVLGFTRREISWVLLGELAVSLLLALPVGLLLGRWIARAMSSALVDTEMIRLPTFITPASSAFAVLVVLGAGLLSALLVRRRLDHLDLIGVLKTRE